MSSYLVAVVVADFACKSGVANTPLSKKIAVNFCARKNSIDKIDYALNATIKLMEFFENFYGIKYPLPKFDSIAIPTMDFGGNSGFIFND